MDSPSKKSAKALLSEARQREITDDKKRRAREYRQQITNMQNMYLAYSLYRSYEYTLAEAELYQRVFKAFRGKDSAADNAHSAAALARAQLQLENAPDLPEDIHSYLMHAGIDPSGKFSELDMNFADRLARIGAAAAMGNAAQKAWFEKLEAELNDNNSALHKMSEDMHAVARQQREYTRAAKLCKSAAGSRMLMEECQSLEDCEAVRNFNDFVTGLEHAFSLRGNGTIPQDLVPVFRKANIPIPQELLGTPHTSSKMDHVKVHFQDLTSIFRQMYFSSPKSWEMPDIKNRLEKAGVPVKEACIKTIRPYLQATAMRTLDIMFGEAEAHPDGISRADLIIIDGRTLRERLMQDPDVQAAMKQQKINHPTPEMIRQKGSEMVSVALMANRTAEAWAPRVENGKVTLDWKPIALSRRGCRIDPQSGRLKEAWDELCRSNGFPPEEKQLDPEAQRNRRMQGRDRARNALQLYYPRIQVNLPENTFDPALERSEQNRKEMLEKHAVEYVRRVVAKAEADAYEEQLRYGFFGKDNPTPDPIAGAHCLARLALAANDSDIPTRQMLDSFTMIPQKTQIGAEFMQYKETHADGWYNETLRAGTMALMDRIENDVRRMDLSDPTKALADIPQLGILVKAAVRLSSEMDRPENRVIQQRMNGSKQCENLQARIQQAEVLYAAGQTLLQEQNRQYEAWQSAQIYDTSDLDECRERFREVCSSLEHNRRMGQPLLGGISRPELHVEQPEASENENAPAKEQAAEPKPLHRWLKH